MKKLLLLLLTLILGISASWATDISVGTATGTFYKDGTNAITPSSTNQYAKKWESTATSPRLTITCVNNNMVINSSDATDTKFRLHTDTYTLSIDGNYFITGYSITAYASNGSSKINDTKVGTSDAAATTVSKSGLATKSTTISVSGTQDPWMYIKSFTVTIAPTYTVTYTIVDGAATVSGGSAVQAEGSAPNLNNSKSTYKSSVVSEYPSYANGYCTYEYYSNEECTTPIETISGTCTVYAKVASTSELPIEFASSVDDVDAQWYTLKLRDYQFYVSGETVTLSSSDITSASAQWVFTGSVCNAYVYNKSAAKYLVMSDGACTLSDTPQPWIIYPHQVEGFYLYYASNYKFPFRNASGNLAYSDGPFNESANAASFVATGIKTNYKEDVVANVKPFFTTGVGSNFGLKSTVQSTYADRVEAAETSCDADEYSALLAVVSNPSNFVYPASGYYRIKNYSTAYYLGKTGSAPTIEFANTNAASVLYLTRSGDEGSYTYTINMQGAVYIGSKNQATGNYTLAVVAPGRFTMNDFDSNTIFGYTYANGTAIAEESLATGGDAAYWTLEAAESFSASLTNANDNTGAGHSYATLCVPFAISGLSSASAYAPTKDGSYLDMGSALSTPIAAGTPVMLVGATNAGTYTANIKTDTAPVASPATTNALTGTFTGTTIDTQAATGTNYVLGFDSDNDNRIGFYHVNNENFPLSANRAYLKLDGSGDPVHVKGFVISWDEETGLTEVQGSKFKVQGDEIFNLAGQRLSRMQKGINIIGGKKILVK